jgi:hypothetical protein
MGEIHVSHFSEPVLKKALRDCGFRAIGSGVDFLDPFVFRKGPVQIVRHILYAIALVIRRVAGINIYNCLWVIARKHA